MVVRVIRWAEGWSEGCLAETGYLGWEGALEDCCQLIGGCRGGWLKVGDYLRVALSKLD